MRGKEVIDAAEHAAKIRAAARALERTYAAIRRDGTTASLGGDMMQFDEFNALVGGDRRYAEDERYRV